MNILFFCQGKGLEVFYQLYLRINRRIDLSNIGFYVANIRHYDGFLKKYPEFENEFKVVKEWEIYELAVSHTPDYQRIK